MITIPDVVENLIKQSPYLEELLSQGIINYSALARTLRPKVEEMTMKEVQEGAIVMALKRREDKDRPYQYDFIKKIFKDAPEIIVRSNLVDITVKNNDYTHEHDQKILKLITDKPNIFLTISRSVFETTIITGRELRDDILKIFDKKSIIAEFDNLSSIIIRQPKETTVIPGVYYMILKPLAMEGINLVEIVSTYTEITLVIKNEDVDKAFSIIKQLF
jgi:aspartokinase